MKAKTDIATREVGRTTIERCCSEEADGTEKRNRLSILIINNRKFVYGYIDLSVRQTS